MAHEHTITFTRVPVPPNVKKNWTELRVEGCHVRFGDELRRPGNKLRPLIDNIDGVARIPNPARVRPSQFVVVLLQGTSERLVAVEIMEKLREHYSWATGTVRAVYPSQGKPAS